MWDDEEEHEEDDEDEESSPALEDPMEGVVKHLKRFGHAVLTDKSAHHAANEAVKGAAAGFVAGGPLGMVGAGALAGLRGFVNKGGVESLSKRMEEIRNAEEGGERGDVEEDEVGEEDVAESDFDEENREFDSDMNDFSTEPTKGFV